MRHVYINSRLDVRTVAARNGEPREWLFSCGEPWLLLTPRRLGALGGRLGGTDGRVKGMLREVRLWHPRPEEFFRALGLEEWPRMAPEDYPPAVCPRCDRVHNPHPADAGDPCGECLRAEAARDKPGPGLLEDRRLDRETRAWMLANDPSAFDAGTLSPNWRINKSRRLERDWDAAINRILLGMPYRRVAKEYNCSVGLLHRKVQARRHWEDN